MGSQSAPRTTEGRRLTKPLIAAVEGAAIAGGTEILQGTDIRVAGESAKFGVSEAKWGLFPLGGSAVRLVRQIPYTIAADILLTGRHIKPPRPRRSAHRLRRPRRHRTRQGPRDRRDDREQRPGRRAGHPPDHPRRGRSARGGGVPDRRRTGAAVFKSADARRGRGRSRRSAPRSSRVPDLRHCGPHSHP